MSLKRIIFLLQSATTNLYKTGVLEKGLRRATAAGMGVIFWKFTNKQLIIFITHFSRQEFQ
jgi:hypothetical protein